MSIIADALKKAQGRSGQRVEEPPPFDLKKGERPPAAAQKPPEKPPVVKSVPKAGAAATTAVAVKAAPLAVPLAQGATPKAKGLKARRWNIRIPIIFTVILLTAIGLIYYVYRIYLPGLKSGGIVAVAPEDKPEKTAPEGGAPGEFVIPVEENNSPALIPFAAPEKEQVKPEVKAETAAVEEVPAEVPPQKEPAAPPAALKPAVKRPVKVLLAAKTEKPAAEEKLPEPGEMTSPAVLPTVSSGQGVPSETSVPPVQKSQPPIPTVPFGITARVKPEESKLSEDLYHFNMAVYFQRKNDIQSALAEYAEVIRVSPENAEVYSNMGVLYNQIGEYGQAVAVLQKALLIDPGYSKAHNNIGLAYYKSGQLDQALEHLTRSTELEPANIESYNNLGLVYKGMNEVKKAEEVFRRALALDANYAAAHYNLGVLYDETGRLAEARRQYEAFIASGGGTPDLVARVQSRIEKLTQPKSAGTPGF